MRIGIFKADDHYGQVRKERRRVSDRKLGHIFFFPFKTWSYILLFFPSKLGHIFSYSIATLVIRFLKFYMTNFVINEN